jgi:CheY-like chemotaxis protein
MGEARGKLGTVKMTPVVTYEILLAEDNPADVTLVREALGQQKIACNLHVIGDGLETLDFLNHAPRLDLVLLDLHLPKCDGPEILRRLRAVPRNSKVPVIVMTSAAAPDEYKLLDDFAVTSYFVKPSDLDAFLKLGKICHDILEKHPADGRGASPSSEPSKLGVPL